MSEDYLWDKTGEDAEIERLESALSVFKYEQTAAPRPSVVVLPERKRGWAISLRFAFAAGFASVLIAGAAFVLWPGSEIAKVDVVAPPRSTASIEVPAGQEADRVEVPEAAMPVKQSTAERIVVRQTVPSRSSRKTAANRRPARERSPALTADEKYAYNQLMLALLITGSKLKIVKDAVNGTDSANNVSDTSSK